MRCVLPIVVAALTLAGCASDYKNSVETMCTPSERAEHPIAKLVSGPGLVMSGGIVIPARDLGGSGKLDIDWADSAACIHRVDNGKKPPKLYDLHKIGMAV